MPQIDIVSYFSIISWSSFLIILGYVLFNLYTFLPLVNLMKFPQQWAGFQQVAYWVNWNHEETADWASWLHGVSSALKLSIQQKE
jgi:uncharacterized protein involved in cysteine biosynthesis